MFHVLILQRYPCITVHFCTICVLVCYAHWQSYPAFWPPVCRSDRLLNWSAAVFIAFALLVSFFRAVVVCSTSSQGLLRLRHSHLRPSLLICFKSSNWSFATKVLLGFWLSIKSLPSCNLASLVDSDSRDLVCTKMYVLFDLMHTLCACIFVVIVAWRSCSF